MVNNVGIYDFTNGQFISPTAITTSSLNATGNVETIITPTSNIEVGLSSTGLKCGKAM